MSSMTRDALSRKFDADAEAKGATVARIIWSLGTEKDAVVWYDFGNESYVGYVWDDSENKYKGTTATMHDLDAAEKWSIGFLSAHDEITEIAEEAAEVAEEAAEVIEENRDEIIEEVIEVAEVAAEVQVDAMVDVAEQAAEVASDEAALAENAEARDDGIAEAEHAANAEAAASVVVEGAVALVPEDDLPPKITHWWYRERGARAV